MEHINAFLVSIRDFFKKKTAKLLNGSVLGLKNTFYIVNKKVCIA